jgi:hypothetical protein
MQRSSIIPAPSALHPCDYIQAFSGISPGNAWTSALMAKPMNITPHNRVIASS